VSDTFDHSGMPADELLAAEAALGMLTGNERARAEQRRMREPAFDALVLAWEERLAPWAVEIDEAAPPPHVWDNIVAGLPPQDVARPDLWQSLAFWRGLALASGALATACLAALIYLGALSPSPPLVAAIDGGGHHHFVATVDTGRGTIAVVPAAFAGDPTRVPELWLVPPGGKPHLLGLLRADRTVTITIPAAGPASTSSWTPPSAK
jgi:anti-sigma-K factor RskA